MDADVAEVLAEAGAHRLGRLRVHPLTAALADHGSDLVGRLLVLDETRHTGVAGKGLEMHHRGSIQVRGSSLGDGTRRELRSMGGDQGRLGCPVGHTRAGPTEPLEIHLIARHAGLLSVL